VADLVPGGNAERAARVVQMFGPPKKLRQKGDMALIGGAVQKGDLLRGLTTVSGWSLRGVNLRGCQKMRHFFAC
jgi:hypothetical protein